MTQDKSKLPGDESQDAQYYSSFILDLMAIIDEAQLSHYTREGIDHLERALEKFSIELGQRHPDAWGAKKPNRSSRK